MYKSKLPQDNLFIEYCDKVPKKGLFQLSWNEDEQCYKWNNSDSDSESITPINNDIKCKKSLLLASGAYSGKVIKHLLDGYSVSIIIRVEMVEGKLVINLHNSPVDSETQLFNKEKNGARLKTGIFTSDMPWWKKMLGGNIFKFLSGGIAIDRETAHQPIYYPQKNAILYCSGSKYHSYSHAHDDNVFGVDENNGWSPNFPLKKYLCMHPHYDQTKKCMLTYTFTHSIFRKRTHVTFYEYGDESGNPLTTNYMIEDRAALHMFGFTSNYYILFSNSLALQKCGQMNILCGKPVLRELDDNYWSDLIIHFIPRPNSNKNAQPFSVDTNRQGFVYHTINCFEEENKIIIDAFVSDLNAKREAAQFELEMDREVFDNNGDPHRFVVNIPILSGSTDPCKSKITASVVDSTIDFHCINSNNYGLKHQYSWIVGHERQRDDEGNVIKTVSSIYKIDLPRSDLDFDSIKTVNCKADSTEWTNVSCYLRTPLFVPSENAVDEDDGYIFAWSYELHEPKDMRAKILIFSAKSLELLITIPVPKECHVPYSVHSWVFH